MMRVIALLVVSLLGVANATDNSEVCSDIRCLYPEYTMERYDLSAYEIAMMDRISELEYQLFELELQESEDSALKLSHIKRELKALQLEVLM